MLGMHAFIVKLCPDTFQNKIILYCIVDYTLDQCRILYNEVLSEVSATDWETVSLQISI